MRAFDLIRRMAIAFVGILAARLSRLARGDRKPDEQSALPRPPTRISPAAWPA
jgi:hypothetical protein